MTTHEQAHAGHSCCHGGTSAASAAMKTDPVCGMQVDPANAKHQAEHAGETWYFCSSGCRQKFVADPDRYLADTPKPEQKVVPGAIYTCPMHPEVRQQGPGSCPKCGMALEPELPQAIEDDSELRLVRRKFLLAALLAVPLLLIAMGQQRPGCWLL